MNGDELVRRRLQDWSVFTKNGEFTSFLMACTTEDGTKAISAARLQEEVVVVQGRNRSYPNSPETSKKFVPTSHRKMAAPIQHKCPEVAHALF